MIMFSSISSDYEKNLKDELYGCFKYIGIPFDILNKMPVRDRKFYIAKHNGIVEDEKNKENMDLFCHCCRGSGGGGKL